MQDSKKRRSRDLINSRHEKTLERIRGPRGKYTQLFESALTFLLSLSAQLSNTLAATTLRTLAEWIEKRKDSKMEALLQAKPTGISPADQQRLYGQNAHSYPASVPQYGNYSNSNFPFQGQR